MINPITAIISKISRKPVATVEPEYAINFVEPESLENALLILRHMNHLAEIREQMVFEENVRVINANGFAEINDYMSSLMVSGEEE